MERLTTADGRTLAYHRSGSGPTLVCHPGGPGFSSIYLGDLAGLGDELELVLLDPRGTGGSDPARGPPTTQSPTMPPTSRSCASTSAWSSCCCSATRMAASSRSSTRQRTPTASSA